MKGSQKVRKVSTRQRVAEAPGSVFDQSGWPFEILDPGQNLPARPEDVRGQHVASAPRGHGEQIDAPAAPSSSVGGRRPHGWSGPVNKAQAWEHAEAAMLAHGLGLRSERDARLGEALELVHLDHAEGVVDLLQSNRAPAKLWSVRSSPSAAPFVIAGAESDWLVVDADRTDRRLPLSALRALETVRSAGICYDAVYVAVPCTPVLAQLAKHDIQRAAAVASEGLRQAALGVAAAGAATAAAAAAFWAVLAIDPLLLISLNQRVLVQIARWK